MKNKKIIVVVVIGVLALMSLIGVATYNGLGDNSIKGVW